MGEGRERTPRPGVSMPAVTTRLESTKQDMRKGRKTASPVSGCSVESTIFLARHSSGVMDWTWPCLYATKAFLACSRPALPTRRVLDDEDRSQRFVLQLNRWVFSSIEAEINLGVRACTVIAYQAGGYTPGASALFSASIERSHLGSVMPAVCLTRPQYVLRSYCESGSARLPGREADMVAAMLRDVCCGVDNEG